jgi:serine/threonine-protein kinase HipA
MRLGVYWDGHEVGVLDRVEEERSRNYTFAYADDASRAISLSLPLQQRSFEPSRSRPFFEALLPEGAVRDQIANQLKLAPSDSFGLLAELGRDCAGALQVVEAKRMSQTPSVGWLQDHELDTLIEELPRHPLGVQDGDERLRLSLAGVQNKAVLVRDDRGRFGRPLDGMPSTHILKPELPDSDYPGLAINERFCMLLAARCGLTTATVELQILAGRPCLVVERFDRDRSTWPPRRLHQEDLCQALGLTTDFKYQRKEWRLPSYKALAELLSAHSVAPGVDRLAGANAAVFHYLIGNADAHAKNISLLHLAEGVRLAPLYDVVSTAAYPQLNTELSLSVGDELDPLAISSIHWSDLAEDFGLNPNAFARTRRQLAERVLNEAARLHEQALSGNWHHPCIDSILETIKARTPPVL